MPSQAMQDVIDGFRERQKASASQAPPTLEASRAAFAPAGRVHPVPDDVQVMDVIAGGVPAHWLAAPGADTSWPGSPSPCSWPSGTPAGHCPRPPC